jgi:hypothetical protein
VFTESTYSWTVLLHVTAALLLIGISIVQFHLTQAIRATSSASDLRTLVSLSGRASRAGPPFAIAALSTGVRLGSYGWWAQSWFHVAIGLWFVQAVLSTKVLRAHVRKLAAALKPSDVVMTPESDAICRSSAWLVGGAVMHGNDFTMVFLMVIKPPLLESLGVAMLAATAFMLTEVAVDRRRVRGRVAIDSAAGIFSTR